jgi:hypothetical protein
MLTDPGVPVGEVLSSMMLSWVPGPIARPRFGRHGSKTLHYDEVLIDRSTPAPAASNFPERVPERTGHFFRSDHRCSGNDVVVTPSR